MQRYIRFFLLIAIVWISGCAQPLTPSAHHTGDCTTEQPGCGYFPNVGS